MYSFENCHLCSFYPCELVQGYLLYKKSYPYAPASPLGHFYSHPPSYNPIGDGICFTKSWNQVQYGFERPKVKDKNAKFTITRIVVPPGMSNEEYIALQEKIQQKEAEGKVYVSDLIGDHFKINLIKEHELSFYKIEEESDNRRVDMTIERWEPSQPVFISAQTGRGKNTFVEKTLLPYIRDLNHSKGSRHKILILSNRIALTKQVKDRLKDKGFYDEDGDENKIYPFLDDISYKDLADVMSYQSFLNWADSLTHSQGLAINERRALEYKKEQKYLFVICDEAHFFTSDSMFNPNTHRILSRITRVFKNAIRVYMTATPYECLKYISEFEGEAGGSESLSPVFYHFKRDYSYLDIKYYSDIKELESIIIDSGDENWLIFIDNIKKGEEYKQDLESIASLKDKVYAVNAESKKDENYQKMVLDERLDIQILDDDGKRVRNRVLIATSVIDNGVNFRDVKNVVLSDFSRVKCLQMLGRARAKDGEKITLYIKRFTSDEISFRIQNLKRRQDAYHDFSTSKKGTQGWFIGKHLLSEKEIAGKPKHWLGADDSLFINGIATSLIDTLVPTYEAILKEMEDDKKSKLPGQKYLEYQLSWFGKTYSKKNDITLIDKDEGVKNLLKFLETYVINDTSISKSEQPQFRQNFTELFDSVFQRQDKNRERNYDISKINKLLEEQSIGYRLSSERLSSGDRSIFWKVVKVDS